MLVDILLSDNVISIARIVEDLGSTLKVQLLSKHHGGIYIFDEEIEEVPTESVCGYYDTDDLENTGAFKRTRFGYEEISSSDSEYEPTDSDESESESDVSLDDED
jgi:hypothetical protein